VQKLTIRVLLEPSRRVFFPLKRRVFLDEAFHPPFPLRKSLFRPLSLPQICSLLPLLSRDLPACPLPVFLSDNQSISRERFRREFPFSFPQSALLLLHLLVDLQTFFPPLSSYGFRIKHHFFSLPTHSASSLPPLLITLFSLSPEPDPGCASPPSSISRCRPPYCRGRNGVPPFFFHHEWSGLLCLPPLSSS